MVDGLIRIRILYHEHSEQSNYSEHNRHDGISSLMAFQKRSVTMADKRPLASGIKPMEKRRASSGLLGVSA